MENKEKYLEYAAILTGKIAELFEKDSDSIFHIDTDELMEGDNLTHFVHALANAVPTHFFNGFTNEEKNTLEFNYLANQLVFQYATKD